MAKKIGIFTESAIDVPKGLLKKRDITSIPIHILINDESKLHGIEIVNKEVVDHITNKDQVETEPPTPLEYFLAFQKISTEYDEIYSLHTSSLLSKAYANARHGLELLKKQLNSEQNSIMMSDTNIKVIDTKAASISLGQIVNRVAKIVKTDYDDTKLDNYIALLIKKAMLFFVVDDLYWLKRAGKLNMFSGFFGKMFNVKPIIKLEGGKAVSIDKVRGKDTALDSLIALLKKTTPKYKKGVEIWIAHSSSITDAQYTREQLAASFNIRKEKIPIVESGPTTTAHLGPGMITVSILPK